MRAVSHWTPQYIYDRVKEIVDHRLNPNNPWLTRRSVWLLSELLRPSDIALEFGSGRSTRWFAPRVLKLTSVEHDETWYRTGLERLRRENLLNTELLFRPLDVPEEQGSLSAYARVLDSFENESLDFCLVDGIYRGACAVGAVSKLRSGGLLAIDNAGWFLPSSSRTPNAQPLGSRGADPYRRSFLGETANWRRIWTSSGVTDTLILIKS
jgi:predicted O-methyltransferase YrrM